MTVNRAETTRHEMTVQDWMEEKYRIRDEAGITKKTAQEAGQEQAWDPEVEFYKRGGVVHRLDKETSGILLLAKNPQAFAELQRQFKERIVQKVYLALAHGKVVPREGEISVPVGRLPWNRKQFGIVPGGRESVTTYKVLEYYKNRGGLKEILSLVELYPHTGRTHQIRVHMKYIGHPLFADFLYAGRKTSRDDRRVLERVFLHAAKISFLHPRSGEQLHFSASLPTELSSVLLQFEKLSEV
jgi:23S rRNA pseudouridine1911/1915/1917 synthase